MKFKLIFLSFLLCSTTAFSQISMKEARAKGADSTVTVKGIITSGKELGRIRYLQDNTGGLATYSSLLDTLGRGDSVEVTGKLKEYNFLLEMDPVTKVKVLSRNNPVPAPKVIVPDSLIESNEGVLVRINNVVFLTGPGSKFAENTYTFLASGQTGVMYVSKYSPLVGNTVPADTCDIIAIVAQHDYSNPNKGYQLLCRGIEDIILKSSIYITSPVTESNISKTGLSVNWSTNIVGTSGVLYGNTKALGKIITDPKSDSIHSIDITGLSASELVYVRVFSVNGTDTTYSSIKTFITQSESSGKIISYFNTPVDTSVSDGINAIFLNQSIDDTLIAYINRAVSTIDFTMYNYTETGLSSISTALNNAYSRGVAVRVIYDGTAGNTAIQNLDAGIKKISSFTDSEYGIMHNKFIVFDANHTDPNKALVWTGGTNLTDGQVNKDPNTVIIVQDKSLAIAYTIEFNEMYGSETLNPDMANAKFGPKKTDNTPHHFIIGGKKVDCYFSPSDGVMGKIIETINTADNSLDIMTMLITRMEIANAIKDAKDNRAVDVKMLVNSKGQCDEKVWDLLSQLLGRDLLARTGNPGIMHHKLMIVDEGTNSEPTLLMGSHNWSRAANDKNDENTLIFYDNQELANIYYQAFKYTFDESLNLSITEEGFAKNIKCYPNPTSGNIKIDIEVDKAVISTLEVYDISGKQVLAKKESLISGSNNITLDLSNLEKGLYIIKMNIDGKLHANTIVVQ